MKKIIFKLLLRINTWLYFSLSYTYYGVFLIPRPFDATYRFSVIGAYGSFVMDIVKNKSCGMFLDIGANQGLFSIIASKNKNIKKITAFEPNPIMCDVIYQNVKINSVREDKFTLIPAAISNETKYAKLSYDSGHSGISQIDDDLGSALTLNVELLGAKSLREYVGPSLSRQFGIKIDVEGYEQQVVETLFEAGILVETCWLVIELNEQRANFLRIIEILDSSNLKLVEHNSVSYGHHGDYLFEYQTP